ncbi:MAG: hypothetical protein ACTSQG_11545, partial [Promethearchaeota archaeon]
MYYFSGIKTEIFGLIWYWWIFNVIIIPIIVLEELELKTKFNVKVYQLLKYIFVLIIFFVIIGIISMIINNVNIKDSLYIIYLRISPFIFLYFISKRKINPEKLIQFFKKFSWYSLPIILLGLFQSIVKGKWGDNLRGFQATAHIFGKILLFSAFIHIIYLREKFSLIRCIICILSIYLAFAAEAKGEILAFVVGVILIYLADFSNISLKHFAVLILSILIMGMINSKVRMKGAGISIPYNIDNILRWEIVQGYSQLFTEVLTDPVSVLCGVGPGNYATNVAISKKKELAVKYYLYYIEIIRKKIGNVGTLLNRANPTVNIIAEFGLLGFSFYIIAYLNVAFLSWKIARCQLKYGDINHKILSYICLYSAGSFFSKIPIYTGFEDWFNIFIFFLTTSCLIKINVKNSMSRKNYKKQPPYEKLTVLMS